MIYKVNHSIRSLPSSFGKRVKAIQSGSLATNNPERCKMFEYGVILEIPNSSNLRHKVARLIPRIPAIQTQLNFKLQRIIIELRHTCVYKLWLVIPIK